MSVGAQIIAGLAVVALFAAFAFYVVLPHHFRRQGEQGFTKPAPKPKGFLLRRILFLESERLRLQGQLREQRNRILALEDDKADLEKRHLDVLRGAR